MPMPELIADIVALSGQRLVGRTRLQKTVYLLDACGLRSGAAYYYYNYGPFSDDVANGISDGKFSEDLREEIGYRQMDGSPFSVFTTDNRADTLTALGDLDINRARQILHRLNAMNSTILELAATIHWLIFVERAQDWRAELQRRKGAKADGGRAEKASELLAELGFAI